MLEISEIRTLDSVWTVCNAVAADNLRNMLSYESAAWIPGKFGKRKIMYKKCLIDSRREDEHYFMTGFVDKCRDYLEEHNLPYNYSTDVGVVEYDDPHIDGITFRPYQVELIQNALDVGRGVIKAPTGSGKSVIIIGIASAFSEEHILFLAHTADLVQQIKGEFEKLGFENIGEWTGGRKKIERITVATVQAYKNVAKDHIDTWDVIVIDEGHHISKHTTGNYFKALAWSGAPCKLAFTATLADSEEARLALEGLVGPVIGELTMAEGTELGFLATPDITMPTIKLPAEMALIKGFPKAYSEGIVKNVSRNAYINAIAEDEIDCGGTVLILVTRLAHIDNIVAGFDIPVEIVKGAVAKEDRLRIKKDLIAGRTKCVIATVAWVEGVDIPTLTCVINAGGMKSEIQTLQKIGRGLRKTKTKDSVRIWDFFDKGNKHLARHARIRRDIYKEQGWDVWDS